MCQGIAFFMAKRDGGTFKAFISRDDGGSLGLYLMTEAEAYDFSLSSKLAEFAAPYIERGLLNSGMLLPASSPEELQAFFDADSALLIEMKNA
jgi:hypothetical protein